MAAKHPLCKWAETTDSVFITFEVADCKDPKVEITEDTVTFESNGYAATLKLKGKVDNKDEDTKFGFTDRDVSVHLVKAESGRWEGLLENKNLGRNVVKPDFDKWVDSDDEEKDAGGFDMSQMGGMGGPGGGMGGPGGGMGGMGGMMGGMGGAGGMGGMMGGMGGMGGGGPGGGMGGADMAKMMEMMKGMQGDGGMGGMGGEDDGEDSDDDIPDLDDEPAAGDAADDELPELEAAE